MDKYEGIKRAKVSLRRNEYGEKKNGIFFRYALALLIVLSAFLAAKFTPALTELFKQDYFIQYAKD